jgi:hypothetical protein
VAHGPVLVGRLRDDLGTHQRVQAVSEEVLGDPEITLDLREAADASKDVAKDEKGPAITDQIQRALDGAIGGRGLLGEHDGTLGESVSIYN